MNDLLHIEELLTNRDGLLTPSLGLFLLHGRGFHDKLFLKIETDIGRNPDSLIHKLFFLSLDVNWSSATKHIFWGEKGRGDSDDCKMKTHSKWELFGLHILTVVL